MEYYKYNFWVNQTVTLPSGTAPQQHKIPLTLPDNYREVLEFGFAEAKNGGDSNYRVGLMKGSNAVKQPVHNVVDKITEHKGMSPLPFIVNQSELFYVVIETNVELTADLQIDVVLLTIDRDAMTRNAAVDYPHVTGNPTEAPAASTSQAPFTTH